MLAIFLALNGRDASKVRDANELGAAGRFDEAIALSREVRTAPADARALLVRARAHTAAQRLREADRAWAQVVRRDPNNWQWQLAWARVKAAAGDRDGALRLLERAEELNPRLNLPALTRR